MKNYFVYILSNWNNKVLYVGVTNDLKRRAHEHKKHLVKGFTDKYNCDKLVYYEISGDVNSAITREKQLKKWRRGKKDFLIKTMNPNMRDLYEEL